MKRIALVVGSLGLLASCATRAVGPATTTAGDAAPVADVKPVPAAALVDPIGTTPEASVEVPKMAPGHGVDFENNWIFDRYGKFRRTFGGVAQKDGRRYDVIKVELWSDHSEKTIYFDITENWNAWTPDMH